MFFAGNNETQGRQARVLLVIYTHRRTKWHTERDRAMCMHVHKNLMQARVLLVSYTHVCAQVITAVGCKQGIPACVSYMQTHIRWQT